MADAAQSLGAQGAWLHEVKVASRAIFQGGSAARSELATQWPCPLPDVCRASTDGMNSALWLGPEELLLLATERTALLRIETPHSWVDVSHRQVGLDIWGPRCEDVLSGACALDLDVRAFPIGMCARTSFAKAEILVWRTRIDAFHVEVWNSFRAYVTDLLCEIARDV